MRPLLVSESNAAAGAAAAALHREGWIPTDAASLPRKPWDLSSLRLLVVGSVDRADQRAAALLAAARGTGLIAVGSAGASELATFFDELSRLGPVELVSESGEPSARLTAEQRRLLELLARGETLGEAARRLALSRRTADRRLAEARSARCQLDGRSRIGVRSGEETRRGPGLARSSAAATDP